MAEAPPQKKARYATMLRSRSLVTDVLPHSFCFTEEVEVLVGPEKKRFTPHKEILCARSTFFKAACSERWNDSKPIELPEDDPDTFDIYLYCVYKDTVDVGDLLTARPGEGEYDPGVRMLSRFGCRLVATYLLADKLGDVVTANLVVDRIIRLRIEENMLPGIQAALIVAQATHTASPLRRLLIDFYVHVASRDATKLLCGREEVPRTFICEIMDEMKRLVLGDMKKPIEQVLDPHFQSINKCRYHQHDEKHKICGFDCKKKAQK